MDIGIYLIIGAFAGLLSGLIGVGGGIIVVPTLSYLFAYHISSIPAGVAMHFAVGTSLATMIFTTLSSSYSHYKHGSVNGIIWRRWVIGLLVGALFGAYLANITSTDFLAKLFGVFLLLISIKMILVRVTPDKKALPGSGVLSFVGLIFGTLSGLLGVGGGLMMVPYLTRYGLTMAQAAGTSTTGSIVISVVATLGFVVIGLEHSEHIAFATGFIYWPAVIAMVPTSVLCAPIGAKLSHVLPAKLLKRVFAVFLFAVAIKMVI